MEIKLLRHTIQVATYLPGGKVYYDYYQTDWKTDHGKLPDNRYLVVKTEEKIIKL